MEWQFLVAMAVVIPIILFPVAYIWYMNIGGIYRAAKKTLKKHAAEAETKEGLAHTTRR